MKIGDFGFSKVTKWHDIGNGIKWKYYRHWGQNAPAGEGKYENAPGGDRSGCLNKYSKDNFFQCTAPIIFVARRYKKGRKEISAILSYPGGIGYADGYFWEIFPNQDSDCLRFDSETKMENCIKRLLLKGKRKTEMQGIPYKNKRKT